MTNCRVTTTAATWHWCILSRRLPTPAYFIYLFSPPKEDLYMCFLPFSLAS